MSASLNAFSPAVEWGWGGKTRASRPEIMACIKVVSRLSVNMLQLQRAEASEWPCYFYTGAIK